ncbi:MAG: DMT family transporter [Oscillibacter sp.]|jgi:drug/metabolite transporter (DMT)-like permease|nr:DMT family transporter [Oscillibacter sp.]
MSESASRRKTLGYAFALFTVLVWGTTFIVTKKLLNDYTPLQIMMSRFVLAYVFLWLLRPRRLRLTRRQELSFVLTGLFSCSLYFLAENTALQNTLASNVSIIVSVAPILTAVAANFTTEEKLRRSTLAGFITAFAGVILVVFNGAFVLKFSPKGDLLALLAAVSWTIYSVVIKPFTGKYDSILLTRRTIFWGMITAVPLLAAEGAPFPTAPLARGDILLSFLFLGLVGSAVCYVLWNEAFRCLGIVATNSFIYAIPFITMVAAFFFLHEHISPAAIVGAVLITAGVILSEQPWRRSLPDGQDASPAKS